jgi:hypothetical protein
MVLNKDAVLAKLRRVNRGLATLTVITTRQAVKELTLNAYDNKPFRSGPTMLGTQNCRVADHVASRYLGGRKDLFTQPSFLFACHESAFIAAPPSADSRTPTATRS